MKTNDQFAGRRPLEPSGAARRQGKFWLAAAIGMGAGVSGGSAYLLLGGEYIFDIPCWASLVFHTGFVVGNRAVDSGMGETGAKVLGVVTVGLTYAVMAVLVCFVWLGVKNMFFVRKQKRKANYENEDCH